MTVLDDAHRFLGQDVRWIHTGGSYSGTGKVVAIVREPSVLLEREDGFRFPMAISMIRSLEARS